MNNCPLKEVLWYQMLNYKRRLLQVELLIKSKFYYQKDPLDFYLTTLLYRTVFYTTNLRQSHCWVKMERTRVIIFFCLQRYFSMAGSNYRNSEAITTCSYALKRCEYVLTTHQSSDRLINQRSGQIMLSLSIEHEPGGASPIPTYMRYIA